MRNQDNLLVTADQAVGLAGMLRHQLTMLSDRSISDRITGTTVWTAQSPAATVFWTWVLSDEGCPVLADPLAIRSNLQFQGTGAYASDDQLLGVNQLVNSLSWQREVVDYLKRLRVPTTGIPESRRRRAKADPRTAALTA